MGWRKRTNSERFCAVARFSRQRTLFGRGTAPWPLRNLQEFPAPIGLKKFLQFLRDRVLSLNPTSAKLSQNPWTLARNVAASYSRFSANFIRPTGAFYLRDSHVFLNRRNRCHINFFANYLFGLSKRSEKPTAEWPKCKKFCAKVTTETKSPIQKILAVARIGCTCGLNQICRKVPVEGPHVSGACACTVSKAN